MAMVARIQRLDEGTDSCWVNTRLLLLVAQQNASGLYRLTGSTKPDKEGYIGSLQMTKKARSNSR